MPDAGEDVEQRAAVGRRVADVVGGDDGHAVRGGEVGQPAREPLAVALEVALHVDGEPLAEDAPQAVEMRGGRGARERPLLAAGEAEESRRVLLDLLPASPAPRPSARPAAAAVSSRQRFR